MAVTDYELTRIMKVFYASLMIMGFVLFMILSQCAFSDKKASKQPWSVRMAESVMKRNPQPWMIDFRESPKWEYTQGLVLMSLMRVWETYGDKQFFRYVREYYDQFVKDDGSIWLYKKEDYNIDRINPGKVLFDLYRETGEEKFKKAIFLLRDQMKTQPRTHEGGFWHKKIYPYQMWLDGIYMASPFLAEYAKTFNEPDLFDEVANQIVWVESHTRDSATGLLYHGWDESRQESWADSATGHSPNFWGRAMGWYAMALVDVLDFFPLDHPRRPEIIAVLNRLANAIAEFQDPQSGVWYQVVNRGDWEGNYLESSASCMFVYALIKGVKKGYLKDSFGAVAQRGYQGIFKQFIKVDSDSLINITMACSVAGLGGDPYRDGSYEYYISEPVRSNDPKAVGPFILACLEFETDSAKP